MTNVASQCYAEFKTNDNVRFTTLCELTLVEAPSPISFISESKLNNLGLKIPHNFTAMVINSFMYCCIQELTTWRLCVSPSGMGDERTVDR